MSDLVPNQNPEPLPTSGKSSLGFGLLAPDTGEATPLRESTQRDSVGYCLVDPDSGHLLGYDKTVSQWLGATSDFAENFTLQHLFPESVDLLSLSSPSQGEKSTCHCNLQTAEGYQGPSRITVSRMDSTLGNLFLVVIRLVDGNEPTETSLDPLTGLPDRRQLSKQRESWQRRSPETPTPHAVLFIDLDDFKQVNDDLGHLVGDSVLATVARRWQHCLREGDLVVRYGGDEFIILLKGVESNEQIPPIVNRLIEAACQPISIDGIEVVVGASIGVAFSSDHTMSLEELILAADRDMYETKRNRKNSG